MIYSVRSIKSVVNNTSWDATDFLKVAVEIPIQTKYQVFDFEDINKNLQLLKHGKLNCTGAIFIG